MQLLYRTAAMAILAATVACSMPRGPIAGTAEKPPGVGGTIAGNVTATTSTVPLAGRRVTAIDVATGARHEVSTSETGGYTIQVPKGVYRLEVELRAGERVSK